MIIKAIYNPPAQRLNIYYEDRDKPHTEEPMTGLEAQEYLEFLGFYDEMTIESGTVYGLLR